MVKKLPALQAMEQMGWEDLWVEKIPWRRAQQPIPIFLPGEFHRHRSLQATVHRVAKESDMTEVTGHASCDKYYDFQVYQFSSVQFSHSVVSDSLQPHELQHARPPCSSPTPGVYPNLCPLSW